jgi:hypothetical protein
MREATHWTVACLYCFDPGDPEAVRGVGWEARLCPRLLGNRAGAWGRFLRFLGRPDTPAERRHWRKKAHRVVKVRVSVEALGRPRLFLAEVS